MTNSGSPGLAVAAFVVSLVAVLISTVIASANILSFILSGGRLRVTLLQGVIDAEGTVWRVEPRASWSKNPYTENIPALHLDVAIIKVENVGRLPASVSDVSLALNLKRSPIRSRRRRRLVAGYPISPGETSMTGVRLEPYSHVEFFFDLWPLIASDFTKGDVKVRASVTRAGRNKYSPKRSQWFLRASDDRSFLPPSDPKVEERSRLFRAIFRMDRTADDAMRRAVALTRMLSVLPPGGGWTEDLIAERLRDLGVATPQIMAMDIADAMGLEPS